MKRREFLRSAAVLGTAAAVPLAAFAGSPAALFTLVRSADATAGARFVPPEAAACADCAGDTLRVHVDGLHRATTAPVLRELWLNAMFDTDGGGRVPFTAWHFTEGSPARIGQRLSFLAARDRLRSFELEFRLAGDDACRREACALTRFTAPLLAPGHYVLLGPRADGSWIDASTLRHSGDAGLPLGNAARDFDYLALRIEAAA